MRKKWPIILVLVSVIYFISCIKSNSGSEILSEEGFLNHHDSVAYVGIEACAKCHADKVNSFSHTGMGNSFGQATPIKSAAKFGAEHFVYDSVLDYYYFPFWNRDRLYIKEFRLAGLDTIFKRIEEIHFVIGSGHHTNSHLTKKGDYLVQAPITFYTQKGEWNLAPGFEGGNNSRFTRVIDQECMTCHNSLGEFTGESQRSFAKIGDGIDCERCHGPGELHVEFRSKGGVSDPLTDSTIVNPRALNWERQIDLCQRCHLQGNNVLKDGKRFSDFKPGQVLSETFEIYLPEYEDGTSQFNMANHSDRLQGSKCFQESGNIENPKLTCITCHNPHVSVRQTSTAFFNEACMDCHSSDKCTESIDIRTAKNDNCVGCHMPPSSTEDIPHVSVHEHKIGIYPDGIQLNNNEPIGLKCVNNSNPEIRTLIKAYLTYYEKFDPNPIYRAKAKELLKKEDFPQAELHYAFQIQDWETAYKQVQSLSIDDVSSVDCYRAAEACSSLKKFKEANEWYALACSKDKTQFEYFTKWAGLKLRQGDLSGAKEKLEHALEEFDEYKPALNLMLTISIQQSRTASAEKYLNQVLALDPDYLPVLKNAVNFYRSIENVELTRTFLERILNLDPKNNQVRELLKEYTN